MTDPRLPVLWICGASGAGKSVAAWALFEELAAAGKRVAYVDIDQLGMLYPEPDGDPGWHHALKAEALARMLPGYAGAGAQLLVVSGVTDPYAGPQLPPGTDLTLCLLAPDPAVLRQRILARGWGPAAADEAVAEDALLRAAPYVDVRLDTAALSVPETVARLRGLAHGRPREERQDERTSRAGTRVVLVTGPRAAGSSTVGFGFARGRWRAGRTTGFLDLQQLGFVARDGRTGSEPDLAIVQLAAMHELMTGRGAELLVVSGHLSVPDRALVRRALPRATVTVVRLRAGERTLREHVRARVGGSDARLAADDLAGAGPEQQDAVVSAALAEQRVLDASAADDAVLDVTGRTPAEVVADVEQLTGPSHPGPG